MLAAAVGLSSCAGLDTRLPDIELPQLTSERELQQDLAFEEMDAHQQRLLDVAERIRVANAELCPRTRPSIGVMTHRLSDYGKSLRSAAKRARGASVEPRILFVAEGSPAALAGLRPGDQLIVDGKPVGARSGELRHALEAGRITARRDGQDIEIEGLEAQEACDYAVGLRSTTGVNAYATGKSITMTSGMMNFVDSDDELALILGHELAHNTMGHIRKIVSNYILSLGATRYARPFESEADYVGLYYLARAGYDPEGVEDVWRRLGSQNPRTTSRAKTHPTSSERFLRIHAAREEIAAKQAAGRPLVPNFKGGPS